jgi:hypothetical protein
MEDIGDRMIFDERLVQSSRNLCGEVSPVVANNAVIDLSDEANKPYRGIRSQAEAFGDEAWSKHLALVLNDARLELPVVLPEVVFQRATGGEPTVDLRRRDDGPSAALPGYQTSPLEKAQ